MKYIWQVCFDRLCLFNFVFLQKNCGLQKNRLCFSFTRGIIKNIMLQLRKLKMERSKCFHEYL